MDTVTIFESALVAKVLGAMSMCKTAASVPGQCWLRKVGADSTVMGNPGRVIHQAGTHLNPLAHSDLPDAEASVNRDLMERTDSLENDVNQLQACLQEVAAVMRCRSPAAFSPRT